MPFMRRRPLLRAAAVGGGAYMVGKHHAQSQADQAAQEDDQDQRIGSLEQQAPEAAPAAPAPAAGGMSEDTITKLKQLGDLHDSGVLTDEEFAAQKAKLLA
jgi:hypothetical protein